jgi:hypothetical protein
MNTSVRKFIFSIGILATTFAFSSCAKDKPCKATITVLDLSQNPVGGTLVRLESNGTIAPIEGTTDASGKVSFETPLPKIMDILLPSAPILPVTGKVARFEEGKTADETVTFQ